MPATEETATVFVDAIRRLYAHDAEATGRILDTAATLSAEQFVARVVEGQRSVRDTLVHMIDTQICHFSWIDGSMSRGRPTVDPSWTVKDIAAHLLGGDISNLSRRRDGFRGTSIQAFHLR